MKLIFSSFSYLLLKRLRYLLIIFSLFLFTYLISIHSSFEPSYSKENSFHLIVQANDSIICFLPIFYSKYTLLYYFSFILSISRIIGAYFFYFYLWIQQYHKKYLLNPNIIHRRIQMICNVFLSYFFSLFLTAETASNSSSEEWITIIFLYFILFISSCTLGTHLLRLLYIVGLRKSLLFFIFSTIILESFSRYQLFYSYLIHYNLNCFLPFSILLISSITYLLLLNYQYIIRYTTFDNFSMKQNYPLILKEKKENIIFFYFNNISILFLFFLSTLTNIKKIFLLMIFIFIFFMNILNFHLFSTLRKMKCFYIISNWKYLFHSFLVLPKIFLFDQFRDQITKHESFSFDLLFSYSKELLFEYQKHRNFQFYLIFIMTPFLLELYANNLCLFPFIKNSLIDFPFSIYYYFYFSNLLILKFFHLLISND